MIYIVHHFSSSASPHTRKDYEQHRKANFGFYSSACVLRFLLFGFLFFRFLFRSVYSCSVALPRDSSFSIISRVKELVGD